MKLYDLKILAFLLGILVCIQVSKSNRLNSKVTREINADEAGGESCPLGVGLMLCPPNHQTWTCFCPTKNESLNITCSAVDEKIFCPEPIVSRIGVIIDKPVQCNDLAKQQCNPNFRADPKVCTCGSTYVKVKCSSAGFWTHLNYSALRCDSINEPPRGSITFPATRDPRIQNIAPPTSPPIYPYYPKPPKPNLPEGETEDADHEMKYGNDDHNYLDTYNQMNSNGQFNNGRRTTPRSSTRPGNNNGGYSSGSQVRPPAGGCKKPVGLIVVIAILAVTVAVLAVLLFIYIRKYKQALQQIIHMNEIYSAVGLEKNKAMPQKLGQLSEKNPRIVKK